MTIAAEAPTARARPLRPLFSVLFAVLLLALASAALKGWRDYERTLARQSTLEVELAATEARIVALRRRVERLQRDPVTLDRVAREELGMVDPRDVVIVLPEKPAAGLPVGER